MCRFIFSLIILVSISSCQQNIFSLGTPVTNSDELSKALKNAEPGDVITMSNGAWEDVKIKFVGYGTEDKPITLRAETAGEVLIQGKSELKLGGEYLVVDGLHFTNGHSPKSTVIQFSTNSDTVANHSRVTNCVIKDFNKPQRNMTDIWVRFHGRHNQLDHCYIAGKSNRGPTIRVDLAGNHSIKNYHKITENHFGPRPPKGGPSAETIQIGNSYTSMAPSYTLVANNLFNRCNGEVEVISSKTNFNEFRNNVFYKSEGSLVTRHGNYCIVDGNYFIGDENSEQIGGVRLIGTGHWVSNNYFYKLKGKDFRGPIAVMNGIPKSPLNRYIQVTDVVIAHNTYVDCISPLQFGIGSNVSQKDVLPASEIRSARPIRTLVANNLIYNTEGDKVPVLKIDSIDGISFKSNLINNQGVNYSKIEGLDNEIFELSELEENILIPSGKLPEVDVYEGFEFDQINKDLFGEERGNNNFVGAILGSPRTKPGLMDLKKYGPSWYASKTDRGETEIHLVSSSEELVDKINKTSEGSIIELKSGNYTINSSLKINKAVTIRRANAESRANIFYTGKAGSAAFEMNPGGELILEGIVLKGEKTQNAFASLEENMSSLYNLSLENCEVSNFDFILKAYKYSFSENIDLKSTVFKNCNNGLELSMETNDKGEYNAENITIENCQFEGIDQNVIDYYRGGYDESTVGGNLKIFNSSFTSCGAKEKNGILLNTYGIVNVDISNNKFQNNNVNLVAQLWGAKNNSHSNNTITNSGKILVEENLKLKLLY